MISLLISFLVLILGYAVYGRVAETVFAPDDRETPPWPYTTAWIACP